MTKTGRFFLLIAMLFLGACSTSRTFPADQTTLELATPTPAIPAPEAPTPEPDLPGISPQQVRNAEYQLGLLDQVRLVQLKDGHYEEGAPGSQDYISVSVTGFIARGDLDADGENEAVAVVVENYGGSGTFAFLAVFRYLNEAPVFLTSVFLGDRPTVHALAVENGEIFVDALIHDTDDPMCCPTLSTRRHYFLNGVNLVLGDYSTTTPSGQPRMITIEAPVNGIEVSGLVRLKGSLTVAPSGNDLVYRIYDLGGVELSAGPVPVDAPDLGAPGTFEKAISLGTIITNTTVRIVVQDINAADGSLFAMDSVVLQVK